MKDWYAEKWNRSQTGSEYLPVEYVSVDELMKDHLADPERRAWTRESESLETQKLNEEVDAQALKLDGLVSPNRKEFDSPVDASDYFRKYSKGLGVDLVGISVLRKEFVYSGYSVPHKYAISLGMRMDPTVLKKVPYSSNHECMKIYRDLGAATVRLAEHIREMGYPARAHHPGAGNGTTQVEHLPVAWSARRERAATRG